jgi:hypothetical protein
VEDNSLSYRVGGHEKYQDSANRRVFQKPLN